MWIIIGEYHNYIYDCIPSCLLVKIKLPHHLELPFCRFLLPRFSFLRLQQTAKLLQQICHKNASILILTKCNEFDLHLSGKVQLLSFYPLKKSPILVFRLKIFITQQQNLKQLLLSPIQPKVHPSIQDQTFLSLIFVFLASCLSVNLCRRGMQVIKSLF